MYENLRFRALLPAVKNIKVNDIIDTVWYFFNVERLPLPFEGQALKNSVEHRPGNGNILFLLN
jgi:hypothetical protein